MEGLHFLEQELSEARSIPVISVLNFKLPAVSSQAPSSCTLNLLSQSCIVPTGRILAEPVTPESHHVCLELQHEVGPVHAELNEAGFRESVELLERGSSSYSWHYSGY